MLVERPQQLWLEVQVDAETQLVWLSPDQNALAFRDMTAAFKVAKGRHIEGGLLRRKMTDRPSANDVNPNRRAMGTRVDLVTKLASNNDALPPFHSTAAELSQMTLIGLLADDLEIEASVAHARDRNRVGGESDAERLLQPRQHGSQCSPEKAAVGQGRGGRTKVYAEIWACKQSGPGSALLTDPSA